jgi:hypothetical protein
MVIYEITVIGRTIRWTQCYKYARQFIKQFDENEHAAITKHNIPVTKEGLENILNLKAIESVF